VNGRSKADLPESVIAAHLWMTRGFRVIPCQPDTKRILTGFGPNLANLTTAADIEFWFRERSCNLAVVTPPDGVILDFDDAELYARFASDNPQAAASLTERTPRGGAHVFLYAAGGTVPRRINPVDGLEVKRVALVYPSTIGGKSYTPAASGPVLTLDISQALRGFATVENTDPSPRARPEPSQGQIQVSGGLIAKVKSSWPLLSYLAYFYPEVRLTGGGRWRSGRCPWHDDANPSLWVDADRGIWGCHSCGAHGDVINWHARRMHLDTVAALQDLARQTRREVPA